MNYKQTLQDRLALIKPAMSRLRTAIAEIEWSEVRMVARELLYFPLRTIQVVGEGWVVILKRSSGFYIRLAMGMERLQLAFIFSALVSFILAFLPWIEYSINLQGIETLQIGAQYKLFFLLPGALGVFLAITDTPRRKEIFYTTTLLVGVLYVAGMLFPQAILTRIKLRSDFTLTIWSFLFGPALLVNLYLAKIARLPPIFPLFHLLFSPHLDEAREPNGEKEA